MNQSLTLIRTDHHVDTHGEHHAEHDSAAAAPLRHVRAAVRRREDRHVAVPRDRNPDVRRPVRRLRAAAGGVPAGVRRGAPPPRQDRWARSTRSCCCLQLHDGDGGPLGRRPNKQNDCIDLPADHAALRGDLPCASSTSSTATSSTRPAAGHVLLAQGRSWCRTSSSSSASTS